DRLRLHRARVEAVDASAVDDGRVLRIGGHVVALAARRDLAELHQIDPVDRVRAARPPRGARILLRAVHPVRKTVVGDDVVELPGGLVVPGAPRLAAVDGDDAPLIDPENAALGRLRVDPELMVVVAAGRALDDGEVLP